MDQNIERRAGGDLTLLNTIKEWVADPLVRQMASLEQQIRDNETRMGEQLSAMREDFRAALSAMSNPETGYVPRSEITLLFKAVSEQIDALDKRDKEREKERAANARWLVGTAVGVATVFATAGSALVSLLSHH